MICIEVFLRVKMHNIQYAQEGRDLVKKKVLELSALELSSKEMFFYLKFMNEVEWWEGGGRGCDGQLKNLENRARCVRVRK